MSAVTELVKLQDLDDQLATLQSNISAVTAQLESSEAVDHARRQLEHEESRIANQEKTQRRLEGEIADLTARIDPEEKRLFSGSVTSTKELMSLEHEVETLKKKRSGLEDELLEVFERIEKLNARRDAARRNLESVQATRQKEEEELRSRLDSLQSQLTSLEQRRGEQAGAIDSATLRRYQDLRNRKGGNAVASLQGQACGGCRVALPDAVRKQVLSRDRVVECPMCERILAPG